MAFRITGLPAETFAPLFELSDEDLIAQGGRRSSAKGGEPCRISLTDAAPGDELILVNHEHLPVDSPYRMRFAVYVRRGETHFDAVDSVPAQLCKRMLAVRAFDGEGMMVEHRLVDGRDLEAAVQGLFANPAAAYLHVHFASPGCYAARIDLA